MVQLSHPYMTVGKTVSLTTWTFVDKVMSLLFNMLSRFVIAFLPRSHPIITSDSGPVELPFPHRAEAATARKNKEIEFSLLVLIL